MVSLAAAHACGAGNHILGPALHSTKRRRGDHMPWAYNGVPGVGAAHRSGGLRSRDFRASGDSCQWVSGRKPLCHDQNVRGDTVVAVRGKPLASAAEAALYLQQDVALFSAAPAVAGGGHQRQAAGPWRAVHWRQD